jgi:hypothetical protein
MDQLEIYSVQLEKLIKQQHKSLVERRGGGIKKY